MTKDREKNKKEEDKKEKNKNTRQSTTMRRGALPGAIRVGSQGVRHIQAELNRKER